MTIIGHLPRFLIWNELNTKNSMIASKKWDIKCVSGGTEKIRRRCDWSVDDLDSMEIWLGKSAKFNGAWVYGQLFSTLVTRQSFLSYLVT